MKYLIFENERTIIKVNPEQIIYITVESGISTFIIDENKTFYFTKSLKELENILPQYFFRIHRSCLVNLLQISEINKAKREIKLLDGRKLKISNRNLSPLVKTLRTKFLTETNKRYII